MKDPRHNGTNRRRYRAQARAIHAANGGLCWLCGEPIDLALAYPDPGSLVADHVMPLVSGGAVLGNVQPAHNRCNGKRGARSYDLPRVNSRRWGPPTLH